MIPHMNNTNTNTVELDIRDIECGEAYWAVKNTATGRIVLCGMFHAAWRDRKEAKRYAERMGAGFIVVKQMKPAL